MKLDIGSTEPVSEGFKTVSLSHDSDYTCDASNIQLPDSSVDHIVSNHMIEHVTRAHGIKCLREWKRLLKPEGRLDITTPSLDILCKEFSWEGDLLDDQNRLGGNTQAERFNKVMRGAGGGHKYIWGEQEFLEEVENLGFEAELHDNFIKKLHTDRDTKQPRVSLLLIGYNGS